MDTPDIRLSPLQGSDVGPFINAAELYQTVNINNRTDVRDVLAIRKIETISNVPDDWTAGDPCLPVGFPLTGVICNKESSPRVIIVNLTNMGITGDIPASIANLTALTQLLLGNNNLSGPITELSTLQLQNNQLTGDIPSSLEKLPMLNELFLENNNLNEAVPAGLIKPGLNLRVHPQNKTSDKKNSKGRWIIGLAVGYKDDPNEFQKLAVEYTEEDIKAATNSYSTFIGKGGFGSVFYGRLSGNAVAVKMLSTDSFQGKQEFRNEVFPFLPNTEFFIKYNNFIHPLLLFQPKFPTYILVLVFLAPGPARLEKPLNWQTRVDIAFQAPEGLLYLHEGCSPPNIHRDIKCSNILLDKRMFAKIYDFGLSKLLDNNQSYITTNVKGTFGYLDPEYFGTSSLNEKSDVYSFGVVLLEIISGVPPKEGIVETAKELLSRGRLTDLMDSSLGGRYSLESAWKVAEIAYTCVELRPINRPRMNTVVRELAEAKALILDDSSESGYALTASSNALEIPQLR
ncbi:probable LRR receptor-like serine/threonine-protein kinase At1g67720 [Cryptomeria japonica]|uniref:probable LRR receptor-like serine/threonine-protein kinase At1g67720 n=1 Tax=Cryptomeria japonica TaxID=3369 RepID=UPI0027DA2E88|nr:probable LRR receptor-like serine/threonine-protein kinase At1g67720 [Cryptomeria japonica]